MNEAGQVVAVVVFPLVEGLLRSDGKLLPADKAVGVFALQARVAAIARPALVDDFVGAPAEGQEAQNLADGVGPGVRHIVHAAPHELGGLFVLGAVASGLNVPGGLSDKKLYCVEHGADDVVVLRHFAVGLDAAAALKLCQELFTEVAAPSVHADAAQLFHFCHWCLLLSSGMV